MSQRKERFNSVMVGVNLGIVAPIIAIVILYYIQFSSRVTFDEYLEIIREVRILSSMISLAAIPNLGIFFLFIYTHMNQAAKGVVISTMIWGFMIVFLKFF